ncbi:MAG: hypothetical protein V2J02_16225 [Pseudomonadales bacterium]|nr:hypothetical protein [Pseudomonadales bacterium]
MKTELERFRYAEPQRDDLIGVRWSEQTVLSHIPKLRAALVEPYLKRFQLRDTYEQIRSQKPYTAEYWVVAETESYIQFFDPAKREFGLASCCESDALASTTGVRGDLVGVFCAM